MHRSIWINFFLIFRKGIVYIYIYTYFIVNWLVTLVPRMPCSSTARDRKQLGPTLRPGQTLGIAAGCDPHYYYYYYTTTTTTTTWYCCVSSYVAKDLQSSADKSIALPGLWLLVARHKAGSFDDIHRFASNMERV